MQWSRFRLLDIYFDTGRLVNSKEKIHIGLELVSRDLTVTNTTMSRSEPGLRHRPAWRLCRFQRIKDDHENQFRFFDHVFDECGGRRMNRQAHPAYRIMTAGSKICPGAANEVARVKTSAFAPQYPSRLPYPVL
jgi:hypothetical protein